METNASTVNTATEVILGAQPAPGADEQKPKIPDGTDEIAEVQQDTPEQQETRRQSKFQRRLDRQKSARVAAETELRITKERLAKLEAQEKPNQESAEPKREDFQDYEAYLRAVAKHDAKQETAQALKADREAREGKEKQQQAAAGNEKIAQEWVERENTFKATTKDYEAAVDAFTGPDGEMAALSQAARNAIVKAGPALLYHLAKNSDEAERIADMSPEEQVMELGALRAKVGVAAKKTTNAPAPASTTSGGKTATTDLEKMSQPEYEAHRKTQGARWAR